MRTIRVLVVHRHRIIAETLARRLAVESTMRAVGIASNEAEADTAVNVLGPDVVVIDMELGNGSAAALTTRMYEREPRVQVVALLGCYGVSAATRAIRAGANAVTTVTSPADHLVSAVVAA